MQPAYCRACQSSPLSVCPETPGWVTELSEREVIRSEVQAVPPVFASLRRRLSCGWCARRCGVWRSSLVIGDCSTAHLQDRLLYLELLGTSRIPLWDTN